MPYHSCAMIDNFSLNVNGRIDDGSPALSLCCEPLPHIPAMPFADTAEETLERFIGMRHLLLSESIQTSMTARWDCAKCDRYQMGEHSVQILINYVNLSMYPAPCQCRCSYCTVYRTWSADAKVKAAYEKLFDMLEIALERKIISENAVWQISTGEITIHPYKDRIMKLIRGKPAAFYTNAFLFDEDIARNLHDNDKSAINLSIDAGTPKTWRKVKGVDNFEDVTLNLARYYKESARPEQITLKYIVLPGVNDNYEDYLSLMEIMKTLECKHLTLSPDTNKKYHLDSKEHTNLIGATAYLTAICYKNGISNDMFNFSTADRQEIVETAKEVLLKGLI